MDTKRNTFTKRYPLDVNGPQQLEITLNAVENKCTIKLGNRPLANPTYNELLQGVRLQLVDNSTLEIQAVFRRFAPQLIISRNGILLPGSEKGEITFGKRHAVGGSAWILVLIFVVVVIGAVGVLAGVVADGFENFQANAAAQATRESLFAIYRNNIAIYTKSSNLEITLVESPKIQGALLRIDKNTNDLDDYYSQHPNSLPVNPETVTHVLWLTCQDNQVGTYDDGKRALQTTCDITLVDLSANAIIDQQSFTGPYPPEIKRHTGDESGGRPDDQIETYVASVMTP